MILLAPLAKWRCAQFVMSDQSANTKKSTEEAYSTIIRYRELNIYRHGRKQAVRNPESIEFYKGN